ncbi:MAG TPA: L,D-transpeptidase family protein [Verrucomicrobiae bacterium]|nr:L,D-transpeptidase family protein [Verrucomicrobiae bacterium]
MRRKFVRVRYMYRKYLTLIASLLLACQVFPATNQISASAQSDVPPLASATQMLVVTTKNWDAVPGVMRRFARVDAQSAWSKIGAPIPIVVGRNGLGWGRGLNPAAGLPGPVKKEGDGKSPAGIFRLSSAFGLAAPDQMKSLKMPYNQLTVGVECVDDVKSAHYNSIVDRGRIGHPDWNSSEKMRDVGAPYQLGVVVDHNTDPREAGGGSCIFLHIWQDARTGTSGCTAMARGKMEALLPWLDPAAHPLLVQLPESEYKLLQKHWQLPPP